MGFFDRFLVFGDDCFDQEARGHLRGNISSSCGNGMSKIDTDVVETVRRIIGWIEVRCSEQT